MAKKSHQHLSRLGKSEPHFTFHIIAPSIAKKNVFDFAYSQLKDQAETINDEAFGFVRTLKQARSNR